MHRWILGGAFALLALVWLAGTPPVYGGGAVTMSVNQLVSVSTDTAGTQILAADKYAKKTCLLNATTNYVMIGDADTTFSTSDTTGTFRLSGTVSGTNPHWWCLDGPDGPYKGSVYGVSGGAGAISIGAYREQ